MRSCLRDLKNWRKRSSKQASTDGPCSPRLVFNCAFDLSPALIVRCVGPSDVARALDFAQNRNLPLAVRAGGHSRAGFGVCEGGMVIDLSGMKRVEVDRGKRVARAEAGALVRDLDKATRVPRQIVVQPQNE